MHICAKYGCIIMNGYIDVIIPWSSDVAQRTHHALCVCYAILCSEHALSHDDAFLYIPVLFI
jgi:hypothetical protein